MTETKRLAAATLIAVMLAAAAARSADLGKVHALADRGRSEQALRLLEDMLVAEPDSVEGQLLRGALLSELGRSVDAERAFRQLEARYPDRPEPSHNLAVLQALAGRPATAIQQLEEIVERHPGYDTAAANLARIRQWAGGEFDPLSPGASRVRLELTARPLYLAAAGLPPVPAPDAAASAVDDPPAPPTEPAPATIAVEHVPEPAAPPVVAGASEPATPVADTAPTAAESSPPAVADPRAGIVELLELWATAWSEQRLKEYLAFYAADFEPLGFASRQAWEAMRRQRVAAPSFIEVEVDLGTMTARQTAPGEARVTFTQRYRSDRFSDTVEKTLDLVREAGAWRIRRETSQ